MTALQKSTDYNWEKANLCLNKIVAMVTDVTKEAKDVDRLNIFDLLNHAVYHNVRPCPTNSSTRDKQYVL